MSVHLVNELRPWDTRCGHPLFRVSFPKNWKTTHRDETYYTLDAVERDQWMFLPYQAQCSKCSRKMATRLHATSEHTAAIECFLHQLAHYCSLMPLLLARRAA